MQTVHRHSGTSHFTQLPNSMLQDKRLSFRARGLLSMMLSLPAEWETHQSWIEEQSPDGRHVVREAIKELEALGYLRREPKIVGNLRQGMVWFWSGVPTGDLRRAGDSTSRESPPIKMIEEKDNKERNRLKLTPSRSAAKAQPWWFRMTERQFIGRLEALDCEAITTYRDDLYWTLKQRGWRDDRGRPIHNLDTYVVGLNAKIEEAKGN